MKTPKAAINYNRHLAFRDAKLNARYNSLLKVYNIKKAEANTKIAKAYNRLPAPVIPQQLPEKKYEISFITRLFSQRTLFIKRLKIG